MSGSAGSRNTPTPEPNSPSAWDKFKNWLSWGEDAGAAGEILSKRTEQLTNLFKKYDPKAAFEAKGLGLKQVSKKTRTEMLNSFNPATKDMALKRTLMKGWIKSGSTVPEKKVFEKGKSLFKIVPTGEDVDPNSAYWVTKSVLNKLMKSPATIEQKLGLPLKSHAAEYKIYKITAEETATTFSSTVANTVQGGYTTTGGAKQIIVPNRDLWSDPIPLPNDYIPGL